MHSSDGHRPQALHRPSVCAVHLVRHRGQVGVKGCQGRAGVQPGSFIVVVLHALEQQGQDAPALQATK